MACPFRKKRSKSINLKYTETGRGDVRRPSAAGRSEIEMVSNLPYLWPALDGLQPSVRSPDCRPAAATRYRGSRLRISNCKKPRTMPGLDAEPGSWISTSRRPGRYRRYRRGLGIDGGQDLLRRGVANRVGDTGRTGSRTKRPSLSPKPIARHVAAPRQPGDEHPSSRPPPTVQPDGQRRWRYRQRNTGWGRRRHPLCSVAPRPSPMTWALAPAGEQARAAGAARHGEYIFLSRVGPNRDAGNAGRVCSLPIVCRSRTYPECRPPKNRTAEPVIAATGLGASDSGRCLRFQPKRRKDEHSTDDLADLVLTVRSLAAADISRRCSRRSIIDHDAELGGETSSAP
jgi:hypothetical protein